MNKITVKIGRSVCILGVGLAMAFIANAHVVDSNDAAVTVNEKIVVPNSGGVTTIRTNTPFITRQQVQLYQGITKKRLTPLNCP